MAIKRMGNTTVWDLDEVATHMEVTIETVREYVREGKLPAQKFGRKYWVAEEDLGRWAKGELPWQTGIPDIFDTSSSPKTGDIE
jgi:excisionase family DNA binding protein